MATRVRWLGHACVVVETDKTRIVFDPFLTGNPRAAAKPEDVEADYILISHGHGDHISDAVDIAKRTGATVVATYEVVDWLLKREIPKAHPMNTGGSYKFPFGRVKLTQAHHSSAMPDGSYGGNPVGFHLFLNDGNSIYNAADTALFGDMRLIGEEGIDLAILPIGDNFTMGPNDALRAIKFLLPRKVMPIHYNTWELITQDAKAWAARVRDETDSEPLIPEPGEWVTLT